MIECIVFGYCFTAVFCLYYVLKINAVSRLVFLMIEDDNIGLQVQAMNNPKALFGAMIFVLCITPVMNLIALMNICERIDAGKWDLGD